MTSETKGTSRATKASRRIRVQIAGMSCAACVNRVRSALERVPGARVIDVGLGSAAIELQPEVDSRAVVTVIAAAGYEVFGVRPLDAMEESSITPKAAVAGGCCCGSKAAHQHVLLRPTPR